jgi:hypothetical protein
MRVILSALFALGGILTIGPPSATAQMAGMAGAGRSLGGYGAASIASYYGGTGGGYLPYAGGGGGFVPYRGGPGGGMGLPPVARATPSTSIGGAMMSATPIGGASLSGMGMPARMGRRTLIPFGYEGGLGMGGMPSARPGGMREASGPGFGYPFRMPPSLPGTSSMGMP